MATFAEGFLRFQVSRILPTSRTVLLGIDPIRLIGIMEEVFEYRSCAQLFLLHWCVCAPVRLRTREIRYLHLCISFRVKLCQIPR